MELEKEIKKLGRQNKGVRFGRIAENKKHKYNDTEEAFYKAWRGEDGYRYGEARHLTNLLSSKSSGIIIKPTMRERVIVATIIQWLGSNCGMGFLKDVLSRCGFTLTTADSLKQQREYLAQELAKVSDLEKRIKEQIAEKELLKKEVSKFLLSS